MSKQASYFVYMLASKRNGTLYVGVTNDLSRRASEHKAKAIPGFTKTYGVDILVWYETYDNINDAITRPHDDTTARLEDKQASTLLDRT